MNNYELLIHKLDEFIRKYYKNKLIKGSIYFVGLFVLFYLLVVVLELLQELVSVSRQEAVLGLELEPV